MDFKKVKAFVKHKNIFDTKNILDVKQMENLGFNYYGTGIAKK
jgi:hypothetical protein